MFARTQKTKFWWRMRRVLFALSAMLFLCPVIMRTGGGVNKNKLPAFTYTGTYSLINDGDGNRRVKFLTSGTLTLAKDVAIDVFIVGSGGGTTANTNYSSGAGGGYTRTVSSVYLLAGVGYPIVVGAGGAVDSNGNSSSAFSYTANGGYAGKSGTGIQYGGDGGSGGAGSPNTGIAGGSDGSDAAGTFPGIGQRTTTREFAEPAGDLYAGGGGSYASYGGDGGGGDGRGVASSKHTGVANTGGGAGAGAYTGGSGIVIIRNHRAA